MKSLVFEATASMRFTVLIPARLASTRLPNKPLADLGGAPMVVRVAQRALLSRAEKVVVATDSPEVMDQCAHFNIQSVMTAATHASGSDRLAEACDLLGLPDDAVVVNVQGDEPELSATAIDAAIDLLDRCPEAGVATLVTPLKRVEDLHDPAAVKAVLTPWRQEAEPDETVGMPIAGAWRAIYFSRAPVPAARDWSESLLTATPPVYWQHVGIYAYRRRVLEMWNDLPESRLAAIESLEQLRVIEAGIPIVAGVIDHAARGIDTPKDYAAFVERCLRPSSRPE